MKKILLIFSILLILVTVLVNLPFTNNPQQLYAFGWNPGHNKPGNGTHVTEPSILILLAGGVGGIAAYRYFTNKKNKR